MVNTNSKQIDQILSRGLEEVIGKDTLREKMLSGNKVKLYLGIDPTSTELHIGHMVPLLKLHDFMELGHEVIFLVGNFTALIGDTSDKESMRPAITSEDIEKNLITYQQQASKILDFSKVKIVFNKDWLEPLSFKEIIELAQEFTLKPFIDRELMAKRLKEEKPIGLHELLYPIMQGYDAYHMDVDLQVGGTDQRFNMLTGRDLQKKRRGKEMAIITTPLIMGTDGRKMSKSYKNGININDSAIDKYGKAMSITDENIIPYFKLTTRVTDEEIMQIEKDLAQNSNPMDYKKQLALAITTLYNGKEEAINAQKHFESVVQNNEIPKNIATINIGTKEISILDLMEQSGLTTSRSASRKLIEQGGVSIDNNKVKNNSEIVKVENSERILQVGKRKFAKFNNLEPVER